MLEKLRTKNGADGLVAYSNLSSGSDCCADPLCAPVAARACSFMSLLPSGPMWDWQKYQVQQWANGGQRPDCPSMALYAGYLAYFMQDVIDNIMLPALDADYPVNMRPENVDYWLERLGWQDCYRTACASDLIQETSPFLCLGPCGYTYTEPDQSEDSLVALKYNIVRALQRSNMGGLHNLAWLNWVIAPLGVKIGPRRPYPDPIPAYLRGECDPSEETPCFCEEAELELCPTEDLIDYPSGSCDTAAPVTAWAEFRCDENDEPTLIHTGVMAAQCIVQSLLHRKCPNILVRCEAAVTKEESI